MKPGFEGKNWFNAFPKIYAAKGVKRKLCESILNSFLRYVHGLMVNPEPPRGNFTFQKHVEMVGINFPIKYVFSPFQCLAGVAKYK